MAESFSTALVVSLVPVLVTLVAVSAVCNLLALVVFLAVKKLRKARHVPVIAICLADLLGAALWVGPSVYAVAARGEWTLSSEMCSVQAIFRVFTVAMSQLMLIIISAERYLRLAQPARHEESVTGVGMALMTFGITLFSVVIACFPLMGWGSVAFSSSFLQCTFDTALSLSHLCFLFVLTYALPLVAWLTFMALAVHKVKKIKARGGSDTGGLLGDSDARHGESYGDKLRRHQARFKCAPMQGRRPNVFENASVSDEEDGDGPVFTSYEEYEAYQRALRRRRCGTVFDPQEYHIARVWWIVCAVQTLLWLPWYVVTYIWTFDVWSELPREAMMVSTVLAFASLAYRPVAYLIGFASVRQGMQSLGKRRGKVGDKEKNQSSDRVK